MPISKEAARQEVTKLVAKLRELAPSERDAYKKKEENTKKDLILPLFRALGWDVENAKEVFAEYDASNGAVDYAFRIGGVSRFFVEAKPLEAALTESKPIKQAIGYALHRGVPWAILTSFDNLHIFYALGEAPKPEMLRWKTFHYTDYIPHFDDLWLLSRDSMESGATDEAAHRDGRLPPRLSIEQRLFRQFREWREKLTNDLLRYHQDKLTDAQVDEVVERLFNRLIFIRNCEDRQIEDRLLWRAWQDWLGKKRSGSLVASVRRIFNQFRNWYDSDLFPEEPHLLDRPDQVHLDDDPVEEIVRGLYTVPGGYADYDFKKIDADVLGAVYEQYLGHVAQVARERAERKTRQLALIGMAAPQIELVEKRAKRKQRGIYYTPKWVVDYIVRGTVGKALDEAGRGKGAAEERLFSIRILDPACGSGSFLIRAYDELLRRAAGLSGRPENHVFADERGLILKRGIYGVDLDPQAVDIARLNLMLRGLARRERLPELKENVQVGNSLISGGEAELRPYFGDAWEAKHPFNWAERFPQVMREGGFDVVIGNPPYVFGEYLPNEDKRYYSARFNSARGQYDLYWLMFERALQLARSGGWVGLIVPDPLLARDESQIVRELLLSRTSILALAHVGQVFIESGTSGKKQGVSAVIVICQKKAPTTNHEIQIWKVNSDNQLYAAGTIKQAQLVGEDKRRFLLGSTGTWVNIELKIRSISDTLRNILLAGSAGLSRGEEVGKTSLPRNKSAHSVGILVGADIARWHISSPTHWIDKADIHKKQDYYRSPKIVVVKTGERVVAGLDSDNHITAQSVYNLHVASNLAYDVRYVLGVLNSALLSGWVNHKFTGQKRLFPQLNQSTLEDLPIRRIDPANKADVEMRDRIVQLVERMLHVKKRIAAKGDAHDSEREDLDGEAERAERQIDRAVYDLYGLTEAERRLVETELGR